MGKHPRKGKPLINGEEQREVLTTKEAADFLRVSVVFLEAGRSRGRDGPPFARIGRAVRYRRAALLAWLAAREVRPAAAAQKEGA